MRLSILAIEGIEDPRNRNVIRCAVILAFVAVCLRLFFWWYTGRVLEDALITTVHSENCVSGFGLTHHASEPRVHGFTSPLSVLVPLMGNLLHLGFGIPFIKIVSLFCCILAVFYVMAIAIHPQIRLPAPVAFLPMAYVAAEHHQVYFGMAGMETQIATTILLMSVYYTIAAKPLHLGISLGLCMLARPDFGFWTIIVGIYFLFRAPRSLPVIVGAAMAVYAPWILFTTFYYGSPLPNPLLAKSLGYRDWWQQPGLSLSDIKRNIVDRTIFRTFAMLGPCYDLHAFGPWARVISNGMTAFAFLGASTAIIKRQWVLWPIAFFALVYWAYYVFLVPFVFGWYLAPFMAIMVILGARGLLALSELFNKAPQRTLVHFHRLWKIWKTETGVSEKRELAQAERNEDVPVPAFRNTEIYPRQKGSWKTLLSLKDMIQGTITALYIGSLVWVLPLTYSIDRQIQDYIENGVRRPMGEYLAQLMKPEETLSCEPLGYVGYYSRKTIYDWPGLGSKKVTTFLRTHPHERTMYAMLAHFRPNYLLLRPWEYEGLKKEEGNWVSNEYQIVRTFGPVADVPAWIQWHYDAKYILLKRMK